jgi:hypothetical protein
LKSSLIGKVGRRSDEISKRLTELEKMLNIPRSSKGGIGGRSRSSSVGSNQSSRSTNARTRSYRKKSVVSNSQNAEEVILDLEAGSMDHEQTFPDRV